MSTVLRGLATVFFGRSFAGAVLVLVLMLLPAAGAYGDTIVKSFGAKSSIDPGRVVAIAKDDPQTVELAPTSDVKRIYGVVIDPSAATVTLQREDQEVLVANSGNYPVMVSADNGTIITGDYLSLSTNDGIAAKATDRQEYILGKSLQAFDGTFGTITTVNGSATGKIIAEINPGKNPLAKNAPSVPGPLLRVANALAGKPVSAPRIYVSLVIFIIALTVAGSLIWVAVRSSLISIGRNPLSKHAITQELVEVIVAAGLVIAGGLGTIYLILKL